MKLTRKTVESASDFINVVEVPQIQYIDRVVNILVCVEDGDLHSPEMFVFPKPVTSELSWFHGLNSSSDSEGEVGVEIIGETMKHPGGEQNVGQNTCHLAVKKVNSQGLGPKDP